MTTFIETLAGKLAERWLTVLVIPGLGYLVAAAIALRLGHARWSQVSLLRDDITALAADPALRSAGVAVLAVVALLAAAAAVSLVVQALGAAFLRIWFMPPRDPVTRGLTARRLSAWQRADQAFQRALVAAGRAQVSGSPDAPALRQAAERLGATRKRINLVPPQRPFRVGDRVAAADHRIFDRYRLDLGFIWPRLWLVMPETTRGEIGTAQARLTQEARLAGWAVAYLILGAWWWPMLLFGAGCGVAAWVRARSAGEVLADLVESAVDVHGRALAESMGIACPAQLDRETGELITGALRTSA
jgi:hypothetical protein